ncbi:hypothetical protein B0J14DRAFT_568649 [Halenospora varia]|nr:hypothetical protein B0J14DRAFT_568649 [Halenospora varia]
MVTQRPAIPWCTPTASTPNNFPFLQSQYYIIPQSKYTIHDLYGYGEKLKKRGKSQTLPVCLQLPNEILLKIFNYLSPEHSTCFGLACTRLYPLHREFYGTIELYRQGATASDQLVYLLKCFRPPDRPYFSSVEKKWVDWSRYLELQQRAYTAASKEEIARAKQLDEQKARGERIAQIRNRIQVLKATIRLAICEARQARDIVRKAMWRADRTEHKVFWDDLYWETSVAGQWGISTEWEEQFPEVHASKTGGYEPRTTFCGSHR